MDAHASHFVSVCLSVGGGGGGTPGRGVAQGARAPPLSSATIYIIYIIYTVNPNMLASFIVNVFNTYDILTSINFNVFMNFNKIHIIIIIVVLLCHANFVPQFQFFQMVSLEYLFFQQVQRWLR